MPDNRGFRHVSDETIASLARCEVIRATFEAPDGTTFERDVIRNQEVVAVVPLTNDGKVLLVEQYRGPIDRWLLEIPAGLCDVDGEEPEHTARRELVEEAGQKAQDLKLLASYFPAAGFSDQFVRLYLATGLTAVQDSRQGVEEMHMTVQEFDLADLDDAIASGAIADSKTIIGLTLTRRHLELA